MGGNVKGEAGLANLAHLGCHAETAEHYLRGTGEIYAKSWAVTGLELFSKECQCLSGLDRKLRSPGERCGPQRAPSMPSLPGCVWIQKVGSQTQARNRAPEVALDTQGGTSGQGDL